MPRAAVNNTIEFTYSTPNHTLPQRSFIKTIEAIGGQRKLKGLYEQFLGEDGEARDFFQSAVDLLRLDIRANEEPLKNVPKDGPVLFIANHPYGVLDGIVLTWLARKARPDVKVMANHVLCQAPDAKGALLPVDFSHTKEALQTNMATRKEAIETLNEGGAIGIFPAGGVAVSEKPHKGPAVDTNWHPFAAKLVRKTNATVIPVYFGGQNSRLFQIASHFSATLRLALFFFETARRIGSEVEFAVGEPITPDEIASIPDRDELMRTLRMRTYNLATNLKTPKTGHPRYDREFEFPDRMKF
ncbi:MAG: lysophospholipid acyltransferase family protein [Rhizobiaceae bacterium]|nr:lysophospholipid acyltransferase family protein [Rhizobiaceae bacterium]